MKSKKEESGPRIEGSGKGKKGNLLLTTYHSLLTILKEGI